MDIQAAGETIKWVVNGITIILMVIAASLAIKKKNNLCLGVAIVGNLAAYFFTRSPLLCMIISIACIIWALKTKGSEVEKHAERHAQNLKVQKVSKSYVQSDIEVKKMVKPGPIIGLIIGIGLVVFPTMGFLMKEASLSDPKGQIMGIGFIVFGALMVVVNILALVKGTDNLLAESPHAAPPATVSQSHSKVKAEVEDVKDKIRCRFCNKLYSSEYNGCPYCKKK